MDKALCVKCGKDFLPVPYTKLCERFGEPVKEIEIIPDCCLDCRRDEEDEDVYEERRYTY